MVSYILSWFPRIAPGTGAISFNPGIGGHMCIGVLDKPIADNSG